MNKLSVQDRVAILNCLSEGMGINGTARVTGKSKNTILKLLTEVGSACAWYQDRVMKGLTCKQIQIDEIWSFVGAKAKNVKEDHPEGFGDCYTFTAIDPVTKLMPCWLVGVRDYDCTFTFLRDLRERVVGHPQITTDGFRLYPQAMHETFGFDVDYAQVLKEFAPGYPEVEAKRRYSPAPVVSMEKRRITGSPNMDLVSTSYVERANLSMRMGMRRFTRLTNAFSKKLENHMHAVSFYFMVYNFVRIHKTIKTTPEMEAGVTDFLWSMEDIVMMSETA